ncbi:MAG: response regulator [Verrucomicrobiaceae bacterium]|nr:MAG: response regulator [Verrucomicrobiaceae bacterium]
MDQVLLVDDDVLLLIALEAGLDDDGYAVTRAINGNQAVQLLEADHHRIRAIVTDIRMPGPLDGWDVARRARELVPDIPVIYITGDSGHDFEHNGVPESRLLEKPFSIAELTGTVTHMIGGSPRHMLQ